MLSRLTQTAAGLHTCYLCSPSLLRLSAGVGCHWCGRQTARKCTAQPLSGLLPRASCAPVYACKATAQHPELTAEHPKVCFPCFLRLAGRYYNLDELKAAFATEFPGGWVTDYTAPRPGRYHEGCKPGDLSQTGQVGSSLGPFLPPTVGAGSAGALQARQPVALP